MSGSSHVLGIDVGGTFTDVFMLADAGRVSSAKAPSTPPDYARGVLDALEVLATKLGSSLRELLGGASHICHGTTAPLNALVTGDLARVGLITTRGHGDSLFIMNLEGRHMGLSPSEIQDFIHTHKPQPLIPKSRVREVTQRNDASGRTIVALNEGEVRAAIKSLTEEEDVEAIAVSLLWSFLAPQDELRVRELVHEVASGTDVSLSHEISPRIGEFARHSTTVMNAQVGPTLERYLAPLEEDLRAAGFAGSLLVMQGSGGAVTADAAPRRAIDTVGSVLAGGIAGARTLARQLGHDNVIATDIGGTTFLVGMIVDGDPVVTHSWMLNRHPVNTTMVQVEAIGSGGGAVSWIDDGGNLRVGPRSAGAHPGPACYGDGGEDPTNTDVALILGILHPDRFLEGRKQLHRDLALKAIDDKIARPLHMSAAEAAAAVFTVQNSQTADLVTRLVLDAGHDPRDFTLYAFGGAGPTFCHAYGKDLSVREILVPLGSTASVFSAFGLATSNLKVVRELSDPSEYPVEAQRINANLELLEHQVREDLLGQGVDFESVLIRREIDVRYRLQIAEVATPVPDKDLEDDDLPRRVATEFEQIYARLFGEGSGYSGAGLQFITYRVSAVGVLPWKRELPRIPPAQVQVSEVALVERRPVCLDPSVGFQETRVYDYRALGAGHVIEGPAVIEAATTTVVVGAGQEGLIDPVGNMTIRATGGEAL